MTGSPLGLCKQAIAASNGDLAKAKEWLRQKGIANAEKKLSREANHGLIGVRCTEKKGFMIEFNCETDFVAKSGAFLDAYKRIMDLYTKANSHDLEPFLSSKFD